MTPSTACGNASAQAWNPNSLTASTCGTRKPASLSSVIDEVGSTDPKKKARGLAAMLLAAAA